MNKRIIQLDVLRIIAAFMVIVIHVSASGFYTQGFNWIVSTLYNSFSRVSVPIMFMISGAILIEKEEGLKQWTRRVLNRALIPYICWSIVYIIYQSYSDFSIESLFSLTHIFVMAPYYHLSFMLQYLSFLLLLPIIRGFWNNTATSLVMKKTIIMISLIYAVIVEIIQPLLGFKMIGSSVSYLPYYIGLAMLGALCVENFKRSGSKKRKKFLIFYILCSLSTFLSTILSCLNSGSYNELFFIYSSPFILLGSYYLFVFILNLNIKEAYITMLNFLSSATFTVYLVHPLILDLIQNRIGGGIVYNPIIKNLVLSFIIFGISIFIFYIISMVKRFFLSLK